MFKYLSCFHRCTITDPLPHPFSLPWLLSVFLWFVGETVLTWWNPHPWPLRNLRFWGGFLVIFEGAMVEYHRKSEGWKTDPLFCVKLVGFMGVYIAGVCRMGWYAPYGFRGMGGFLGVELSSGGVFGKWWKMWLCVTGKVKVKVKVCEGQSVGCARKIRTVCWWGFLVSGFLWVLRLFVYVFGCWVCRFVWIGIMVVLEL